MATSKHIEIRAAVAALFLAGTPLAGGNVLQNRDFALAGDVAKQLHVNLAGSTPEDSPVYAGRPRDWSTEIELVVLARADGGSQAHDVADAIWVDAYGRLMANQTLGGLVMGVDPGEMTVDPDEADTSLCRLTWRFTCKHRTTNDSISS
jgi:hypothetical protein